MSGCRANTPAPRKHGYSRQYRLTRESDLENVKTAGRRVRTEHLEIRAIDSLLSHARAAVIVGKFGHTVVERNRLRRRLRELARQSLIPELKLDVVVRALPGAYAATFDQLRVQVDQLYRKLRMTSSEPQA